MNSNIFSRNSLTDDAVLAVAEASDSITPRSSGDRNCDRRSAVSVAK